MAGKGLTQLFNAIKKQLSKTPSLSVHNAKMVTDKVYKAKQTQTGSAGALNTKFKEAARLKAKGLSTTEIDADISKLQRTLKKDTKTWQTALDDRNNNLYNNLAGDYRSSTEAVYGIDAANNVNRLKLAIGGGAVLGTGMAAMTGENMLWGAAKGVVSGALFEAAFPLVTSLDFAHTIAQTGLSLGRTMDQMDQTVQLTRVNRDAKYNPVGPPTPDTGNTRRRSASYQQYSKQNTSSFVGSEASFMHGTT